MSGANPGPPPALPLLLARQEQAWRAGDRAPVEAVLREHPALRDDDEAILDLIYGEIMLREQAGEGATADEYVARFPRLEGKLRRLFEVERALDLHASLTPGGANPGGPAADPIRPVAIPGYEILGELGQGGMGVVYKARHVRLNRVVALKMILAGEHADPEVARRFLAEAEAVARLQHPNIVQIFSFGSHQGNPFLEMEYVAGGNLADRIRGGPPLPAPDAARLVESLARSVHEVHRVGIVHRDLKPANVLLAPDGTPKVADFGLAVALDGGGRLTQTLRIVGSPSYMAPEQAGAGRWPIGPRADVYALGAILYELLTARPPFAAMSVLETLEQVKSAEPVPPARLRPGLPRDLATICLACLRKDPARRYAGADVLAEDLRRFAAGEPILARPAGRAERAWLWCRREPALACLAAALIAGFLGVATQWWRAERHLARSELRRAALQEANARERQASERAQARFKLGMQAIDAYASLAGDDEFRRPAFEGLRKRLLGTALKFYAGLQGSLEREPGPQARVQLAAAYHRLGNLHKEVGEGGEAVVDFRRELAIREALSSASPSAPRLRKEVADAHMAIGWAHHDLGDLPAALVEMGRATEVAEALVREHPGDADFRGFLSLCLDNLGLEQGYVGRLDEAVRLQGRALAMQESLARDEPGKPWHRARLAWAHQGFATTLRSAGRAGESLEHAARAVAIFEGAVRDDPGSEFARTRMATSLAFLGEMQRPASPSAARRSLERSLALREALAGEKPHSQKLQIDLAQGILLLAVDRARADRLDEAVALTRRATAISERFTDSSFHTPYNLACALAQCGAAARRLQRGPADPGHDEGRPYADRAMESLKRALAAGFAWVPLIRTDADLDPLRARRDFQDLLLDLAFPPDPFLR